MKYIFSLLIFSISVFAQAEVIVCENQSQDIYKKVKLEITVPEDEFGFVEGNGKILDADLKFPLIKQSKSYKVFRTQRQNKIYYFDVSSKDVFSLKLGTFKPSGRYQNVELVTDRKSWFGLNLKGISCMVEGEVQTPSMCEGLSQEKIDEKFLKVIRYGSLDEVEQMIDCGANVNATDKYNCSPLLNLVDGACGYTSTNGKYPEYGATRNLDLDKVITLLIDNGAIIEAQDPITLETPLIKLVGADRPYEIQTLIDYEADINAKDIDGNTALMHAAASGRKMLVKAILAGVPDMELANNKGQTAYDIAKEFKQNHLLPLLTPTEKEIVFEGKDDGSCAPDEVMITNGKTVKIILKASQTKMFLFESPELGIELMAMKGSTDQVSFKPEKAGTFKFTCGIHGGSNPTQGTIMVH